MAHGRDRYKAVITMIKHQEAMKKKKELIIIDSDEDDVWNVPIGLPTKWLLMRSSDCGRYRPSEQKK